MQSVFSLKSGQSRLKG